MSATLTKEARDACESTLNLLNPVVVDVGTDRPNLLLRILPMRHPAASFLDVFSVMPELLTGDDTAASVEERRRQFPVTLIYINNKDVATSMYRILNKWCAQAGFEDVVDVYHADMSEEHLETVHARIMTGKTLIAICTDAFGMGADCRPVKRVIQLMLFGGVSAWWQRMGRAGRDFADEAEAILFVDPVHIDAETKKCLQATGQLPEIEERPLPQHGDDKPSLIKDAAVLREGRNESVTRKIVDDELVALATHGLARDVCIRRLVLDHLRQPEKELLPTHEELYSSSRHIPSDRRLICCSTCNPRLLPTLPDDRLPPPPPVIPTLPGVMALQKSLQVRLEEWREEQWRTSWKATKKAGRMGVDAFLSLQAIESVVNNLKAIAHNMGQGNARLEGFVTTRFRSEILSGIEQIIEQLLKEDREKREQERAEAERARQQKAEEIRKKREAERMARSERDRQERVQRAQQAQQAEASGSTLPARPARGSECTICKEINQRMGSGTVEGRAHRSDNMACPSKVWLRARKPEEGSTWPEPWMALAFSRATAKKKPQTKKK